MKKLIAGLFVFALSFNGAIAGDIKIAVVNLQRILTEAPQVEAVNASMLDRFGPERDALQAMEKDIKAKQENYKKNELVMTEDKLNDLKNEIIKKVQEYKQKEAQLQQEVATVRNQELSVLQQQVTGIVEDVAKKGKYDLVLTEGIAYYNPDMDVTDKVLDKMKEAFKKKKK